MKETFCAIITKDFLPHAKALSLSLKSLDPNLNLQLLIVDTEEIPIINIEIHLIADLKNALPEDFRLVKKFDEDVRKSFRWALKPLFLKYLLLKSDFHKVIYIDTDIFFFNNPSFLFRKLDNMDILLTPHWRSIDPHLDSINFELLFSGGIYNAGFFGCNRNSISILDWWLKVCCYRMEKKDGFYDDQAYLNLLPIYFSKQVKIIEHKGCNVAGWNQLECRRMEKDGEVLIEGEYPVIFIHFTQGTINNILSGKDYLLAPHLQIYKESIRRYLPEFEVGLSEKSEIVNKSKFMRLLENIKLKH